MKSYRVIRLYQDEDRRPKVVRRNLTLEEAKAHCNDPETSSRTCTKSVNKQRTKNFGPWFDGFECEQEVRR